MPAPVFTRRFAFVRSSSNANQVVFTADTLHVYVIRDVFLVNETTAAATGFLYLVGGPTQVTLIGANPFEPAQIIHLELRQEILPSEQLVVLSSSALWSCAITGYAFNPA